MRSFLLALLIALSPAAAAAENLVIIAATDAGDGLQPGAMVATGTPLKLPAGTRLTLLSQSGAVVHLDGPFTGPVQLNDGNASGKPKPWSATLSAITDAVSKKVDRTNVVGSSRDVDTPTGDPHSDAWLLAVDSSGHRCLRPGGADLWRREADGQVKMDLRSKTARETGLVWPAGESRMKLPQKFVADGTLVVMKIDTQPRRFNIHVLPEAIADTQWGGVLNWMIASDCTRQAALLIDALHSGDLASE